MPLITAHKAIPCRPRCPLGVKARKAILLTLFYLGINDIRLGPSLPAFVTANVFNVLVDKLNIMPIKTPEEDLPPSWDNRKIRWWSAISLGG
jgi:hypothetical protein